MDLPRAADGTVWVELFYRNEDGELRTPLELVEVSQLSDLLLTEFHGDSQKHLSGVVHFGGRTVMCVIYKTGHKGKSNSKATVEKLEKIAVENTGKRYPNPQKGIPKAYVGCLASNGIFETRVE